MSGCYPVRCLLAVSQGAVGSCLCFCLFVANLSSRFCCHMIMKLRSLGLSFPICSQFKMLTVLHGQHLLDLQLAPHIQASAQSLGENQLSHWVLSSHCFPCVSASPCPPCPVPPCGVGACHASYRKSGGFQGPHHVFQSTVGRDRKAGCFYLIL